ncbi:MAG TPA: DUF3300 domain-containing protein [Casimicrobiaceae bacterium]|nr:DUF3300 domain-containing protein [Casimicrobiaceae bacterium]
MNFRGTSSSTSLLARTVSYLVMAALAMPVSVIAQQPPPQQAPAQGAAPATPSQNFKQEELDQMLAPIALYPDALVTQVLMASTYPLDIVEADRWVQQNKSLKGDALRSALQQQKWDESVKSLCEFPDVLDRMNKDIAWTQKLGDAFLGQQKQVLDTIQSLRQRAQSAGNLKTNEYQKVDTQTQEGKQVIVIEPAKPDVVYVPTYQPTVVYGAWPYPAYPPYYPPYWAPLGGAFVAGFAWGVGIAAAGALWGGCNWGRGDVNINVNKYNNFNKTNISNGNWKHNADRRGGVPYRDNGSRQQYGNRDRQAAQARNDFRGRDQGLGGQGLNDRAGRQEAANRGVGQGANRDVGRQGGGGAGSRDFGGGAGGANRAGAGGGNFGGGAGASNRGGGFNSGGGGAQTRDFSSRGNSSMGNRSVGGGGGGARAGGGGARGGGGGRGGGGRR